MERATNGKAAGSSEERKGTPYQRIVIACPDNHIIVVKRLTNGATNENDSFVSSSFSTEHGDMDQSTSVEKHQGSGGERDIFLDKDVIRRTLLDSLQESVLDVVPRLPRNRFRVNTSQDSQVR
ncbi:unnamed protein product [Porites lobata]|uniref:Uncharacterized protein n=1 Tax=Porites lobata TaxID=104759 RepID=A0ABN8Q754_9CNID|nr:unnamed protein product [Porites lobata]